jgi:hypothetical protein
MIVFVVDLYKGWSACFVFLFFCFSLPGVLLCRAALLAFWFGASVLLLFRETCVLVFLLCNLNFCSLAHLILLVWVLLNKFCRFKKINYKCT